MTTMRHPNVTGEIDVPESAVGIHAMSGWMTVDEWRRAGFPEPEPAGDGQVHEDEPDRSGEDSKPRRSRRATSKEGDA